MWEDSQERETEFANALNKEDQKDGKDGSSTQEEQV